MNLLSQNTQCDDAIAQFVANQEQQKFHLSAGFGHAAHMTGYSPSLGPTSYPSTAYGSSGYAYAQKFQ